MLRHIAAFVVAAAAVVTAHFMVPPSERSQTKREASLSVVRIYDVRPLCRSMRTFDDRSPVSISTHSAGLFGDGDNGDHGPYSPPTEAEHVDSVCRVIEDMIESH